MDITLKEIIRAVKEMPEEVYTEVYQHIQTATETARINKETAPVKCVKCGGTHVVRNGKHNGRQAYLCRDCGKSFVQTTDSPIAHSHSGETVWKQVIRDTVDGVSIDKTAESLGLSHPTVFNMRHKILLCVEHAVTGSNSSLDGVYEADETYVLESVKGRKIPPDYHRKPRKHGAVASKRGISDEYICICTSVGEDNQCTATSINRATPTKEEVNQVFGDKVNPETVILCDGNRNYDTLNDRCTVAHTSRINRVNGFHSYIKDRLTSARGVATIYLNRYNALFAETFGKPEAAVDKIFDLMTSRNGTFLTIKDVKTCDLLVV